MKWKSNSVCRVSVLVDFSPESDICYLKSRFTFEMQNMKWFFWLNFQLNKSNFQVTPFFQICTFFRYSEEFELKWFFWDSTLPPKCHGTREYCISYHICFKYQKNVFIIEPLIDSSPKVWATKNCSCIRKSTIFAQSFSWGKWLPHEVIGH